MEVNPVNAVNKALNPLNNNNLVLTKNTRCNLQHTMCVIKCEFNLIVIHFGGVIWKEKAPAAVPLLCPR